MSLLRELIYEVRFWQWHGDNMYILCTAWHVLRSYIRQDKLDRGTGELSAPDKGEMPYMLAQGKVTTCAKIQQHTAYCRV